MMQTGAKEIFLWGIYPRTSQTSRIGGHLVWLEVNIQKLAATSEMVAFVGA